MKYCPTCLNQYTDLTLKFCLQDGTPLSAAPSKQSGIDTVAFALPVTEQNFSPTRDYRVSASGPAQTVGNLRVTAESNRSSRKPIVIAAALVPLAVIVAVGGGAGWIYFSGKNENRGTESVATEEKHEIRQADHPPFEVIKTTEKIETVSAADSDNIKAQITDLIERWKDLTEGHNAEKLAAMYGEKVDYLGRPGFAATDIRSELQKTFDAYSDIDIEISNLLVAVDAEGTAATALFDKEWSYEAAPKLSEGKAHFKLHLQKDGGGWKIVTEKQLKVYFTQN